MDSEDGVQSAMRFGAIKKPYAKHDGKHDNADNIEKSVVHNVLFFTTHGNNENDGANRGYNYVGEK